MKTGIELITIERKEQIKKHGRTVISDVSSNWDSQLRIGAIKLLQDRNNAKPPSGWDKKLWKKMLLKQLKDRLIIAGALIAAEIDRINFNKL